MSAFEFDDEQLAALTKAVNERLNRLELHPHQRINFPPMAVGRDVSIRRFETEHTLDVFKRNSVN